VAGGFLCRAKLHSKESKSVDKKTIAFISTNLSWGGSEELWARTAREVARRGFHVGASVGFTQTQRQTADLIGAGIDVFFHSADWSLPQRLWAKMMFASNRSLTDIGIEKYLVSMRPDLVVISDGVGLLRTPEIIELCVRKGMNFVTISQLNGELFWPNDELARRLRESLAGARRCYFVSQSNRRLFEKQIGTALSNAEVICNPFNVDVYASPSWPALEEGKVLRLASVGRLEPLLKGQDILLEALAAPQWRDRKWHLTFYGDGPMRNCIERLVERLGLDDYVEFAGHVAAVEKIWTENHALVMPSRFEGMPLAMVEAMLCARAVVATDVAGHAEIVRDGETGFLAGAPTAASLQIALERLWERRFDLEAIGKAGADSIRRYVPNDPIATFADKIIGLAE
jgi:glycosyltransferase involved in cell wall biosynthesis